jgi:hypothetical protein
MMMVYATSTFPSRAWSQFIVKKAPINGTKYEIIGGEGHYTGDTHYFSLKDINRQFVLLNEPWESKLSKLIAIMNQLKSLYGDGFTEEFYKLLLQLEI